MIIDSLRILNAF